MGATMIPTGEGPSYVGRGGHKLRHALDTFGLRPEGMECADFGCNVGGFTDCLLQAGAAKVHALDTGYGVLAWKLRQDPRVVVRERSNALHADPPTGGVDLVVIDMAWTPQRLCVPAAIRWLRPTGRIITLIKPHYEASDGPEHAELIAGVLPEQAAERVLQRVLAELSAQLVRVEVHVRSVLLGGKGKKNTSGNTEYLALLSPANRS